jgi:hypothetical protein
MPKRKPSPRAGATRNANPGTNRQTGATSRKTTGSSHSGNHRTEPALDAYNDYVKFVKSGSSADAQGS